MMKGMRIIFIGLMLTFALLAITAFAGGVYRLFFTPLPSTHLFIITGLTLVVLKAMYNQDRDERNHYL